MPFLKELGDGREQALSDVKKKLTDHFQLSEEALKKRTRQGNQTQFVDRCNWTKAHLKGACLIEQRKRGFVIITERGKKELAEIHIKNLPDIDAAYLRKFSEYCKFQNLDKFKKPKKNKKTNERDIDENESFDCQSNDTPIEQMESAYEKQQSVLKQELLEKIMKCDWRFFEELVVKLLINLGYGGSWKEAGKAFTTTQDGGIDGVIKEDKLGLDQIYIQAKKWAPSSTVTVSKVREFAGALQVKKTKKGVFITTACFTKEAKEFVKNQGLKIVLIDGDSLTGYMIESNTGVSSVARYDIKEIDHDFFEDD